MTSSITPSSVLLAIIQASQAASAIVNLPNNPSTNDILFLKPIIDRAVQGIIKTIAYKVIYITNKPTAASNTGGGCGLLSSLFDGLGALLNLVTNAIGDLTTTAIEALKEAVDTVDKTIKDIAKVAISLAISQASQVISLIADLPVLPSIEDILSVENIIDGVIEGIIGNYC
jgi:hypothetical protein